MRGLTISGIVLTTAVLIGGAGCVAGAQPGPYDIDHHARFVADVDYFYDSLTPYGLWVSLDPYGPCWVPDVPADWRPYSSDGYWVRSDYGWTWVSYEPWGWAPFHYGRWAYADDYGWVWIPGREWAPAWVAWRYGDGVVGWAPLPPEAHWQIGIGFSIGDFDAMIGPRSWCFVRDRDFVRPHIGRYVFRDDDDNRYFHRTHNATRYREVDGRIVNEGIDVRHIEDRTGRRLPIYRVVDRPDPRRETVRGRDIQVYRPEIRADAGKPDGRPIRSPEYLQRQADENRQALQRQREERTRFEERYRARMQSLPASERQSVERQMTKDIRQLDERQRVERRQIVERNAKARGNPKDREDSGDRGNGRGQRAPNERGSNGNDKR